MNGGGSFTVEGKYIILQRRNAHKTLQYFFKLYFPPISIFLVSDFEQQAYFFSSFRNCALERSFPSLQRANNEFPIMSYTCCSFFPPRRGGGGHLAHCQGYEIVPFLTHMAQTHLYVGSSQGKSEEEASRFFPFSPFSFYLRRSRQVIER